MRALVCEFHAGMRYERFAEWVQSAGFVPFRRGALFRTHAAAVRRDWAQELGL